MPLKFLLSSLVISITQVVFADSPAPTNNWVDSLKDKVPTDVIASEPDAPINSLPPSADLQDTAYSVIPTLNNIPNLFRANIQEHSAIEMLSLLQRAEEMASGQDGHTTRDPIIFVLSGDEITLFERGNYRDNKPLIDLAARLEAFDIVDLKVCRYWIGQRGIEMTDLPPFVEGVSSAEQENIRLLKAGYAYF